MYIVSLSIILTFGCKSQNKEKNSIPINDSGNCPEISYDKWFGSPHGINSYYDFDEGLLCSEISNKPYLVYFTGHGYVKAREMEEYVWSTKIF